MSYLLIFAIAGVITYLVVPSIRHVGLRLSIIDKRSARKVHSRVVTRFGGLAIYLGFIFAIGAAFVLGFDVACPDMRYLIAILLAATLMLILGIYDDARGANALTKFSVQVLAALLLIKSGVVAHFISNPFGFKFALGLFSAPLTVLWLVGMTNAINLIDGLDGLAAGIVFINAVNLFLVYVFTGYVMPAFFAAALAGACLGFLPYNVYPAKIFMGDTGSLFIGFAVAALAVFTEHKSSAIIGLLIPIIGLSVPILDTSLAFGRRLLRGDNPFKADKQHIHHWFLRQEISDRNVAIILWTITLILNVTVTAIYLML